MPCRIGSASTRCCHCYIADRKPDTPVCGSLIPTQRFRTAVQCAKIGLDKDIPRVTPEIIVKYVADLELLGLL